MSEDDAWWFFQERGVIIPGYEAEIAARRRVALEWAEEGVSLQ